MKKQDLRALGKEQVGYDRQVRIFGKEAADNVLSFWLLGYGYRKKIESEDSGYLEKLDELYENSKDIIHGYLGFNVSPEAGNLLKNLQEMRDLAAVNMQKNNSINSN